MKKVAVTILLTGIALLCLGFALLLGFSNTSNETLANFSFGIFLLGFGLTFLSGLVSMIHYCVRMRFGIWSYGVIALGVILGCLTWHFSESFTGEKEAWDATGYYYVGAMIASGLGCGLLAPRAWFASSVGILTGQLLATNFGLGMFGPVGTIFLFIYSVPALIGALSGRGIVIGIRAGIKSLTTEKQKT